MSTETETRGYSVRVNYCTDKESYWLPGVWNTIEEAKQAILEGLPSDTQYYDDYDEIYTDEDRYEIRS